MNSNNQETDTPQCCGVPMHYKNVSGLGLNTVQNHPVFMETYECPYCKNSRSKFYTITNLETKQYIEPDEIA